MSECGHTYYLLATFSEGLQHSSVHMAAHKLRCLISCLRGPRKDTREGPLVEPPRETEALSSAFSWNAAPHPGFTWVVGNQAPFSL